MIVSTIFSTHKYVNLQREWPLSQDFWIAVYFIGYDSVMHWFVWFGTLAVSLKLMICISYGNDSYIVS